MDRLGTYGVMMVAILVEVVATTALARSAGFTRALPTVVALGGYGLALYFMSHALKVLPTGVVYGVWSGLGLVLIAAVGRVGYGQRLGAGAVIGLGLILAGVLTVHLFSPRLEP